MTPPPSLDDLVATVRADAPSGQPLDLLATAASTAEQLSDTGDALLDHFVNECRHAGHSWTEISGALGVTKQAAHKRFAATPTFERFTPRAKHVLETAAARCRAAGSAQVQPEHLLLALYDEPKGVGATALVALGASLADVSARLGPAAAPTAAPEGKAAPWSPPARNLLRETLDEALALGHNYIGTEHLLLALVRDPAGAPCRVLGELGVPPEAIRAKVTELLSALG